MPLQVDLVSPERILYQGEADMVIARTVGGGDIAFLSGHAPFVGALDVAPVTIRTASGDQVAAVHGGFIEISGDKVSILSDVAELADQIDVERAEAAKARAEAVLARGHDTECEASVRRAHARLTAAGGVGIAVRS